MSKQTNSKSHYKCENCGSEHDGSYGSGRFCCAQCARSFSSKHVTADGRKKQIEALTCLDTRKKLSETRKEKAKENKKKKAKEKKKKQRKAESFDKDIFDREIAAKNLFKKKFKGNTKKIGTYGENVIINKCIEHDIPVYLPVVDDAGVDMIMEINGELKKVQIKTASDQYGVNKDKIGFHLSSCRLKYDQEERAYKPTIHYYDDKIDLFALYDIIHNRSYLIENNDHPSQIRISQSRSSNPGNDKKIHHCDDYDFDHVIEDMKAGMCQMDIVEGTYEEIILDVDKK